VGKAKQWFYKDNEAVSTWRKCSEAFLTKFFPIGKTNALRGRITNFQQELIETIPKAWEKLQEHVQHAPTIGWKIGSCSKTSMMG
jgi:hypothetical protein